MGEKKENIQTLISRDKRDFILLSDKGDNPDICTSFSVKNYEVQSCLTLDINRIIRTQVLLTSLPSVFIMHSDGRQIEIDGISKIITFNYENLDGMIHYQITDRDTLEHKIKIVYEKIKTQPQYLVIEDDNQETKFHPNTLKIFPITLEHGCTLCIIDAVEKILHCPIFNPKEGFIGIVNAEDKSKLITYNNIWPDLEFKFVNKDKYIFVYSNTIKEEFYELEGQYYIKIHRNFGGSDLEFHITHKVLEGFEIQFNE